MDIRFQCQPGCTACCEVKGYVYLTEQDLERAAAFAGLTAQEFERKYVYRTRHLLRLRKPRDRNCEFLGAGVCTIHPAKPTQCRVFPFWPEMVEDRREWKRAGKFCPGIGQGPLVQIGTALEKSSEMKKAYPSMY
ncbi:MAG: YkgJ family cysteine cluster protein [Acidobacteria bacterium]|nr:YkgJ family cysteine cluster protein [Acidobacteriota bacterium]